MADAADILIEAERAEGVHRASAALAGKGSARCDDCDELIPLERSQALPAARRCLGCQELHEAELAAAKERGR